MTSIRIKNKNGSTLVETRPDHVISSAVTLTNYRYAASS